MDHIDELKNVVDVIFQWYFKKVATNVNTSKSFRNECWKEAEKHWGSTGPHYSTDCSNRPKVLTCMVVDMHHSLCKIHMTASVTFIKILIYGLTKPKEICGGSETLRVLWLGLEKRIH